MLTYLQTWYLSAVPVAVAAIMMIAHGMAMKRTSDALMGAIKDERDLGLVRRVINQSMILAVVYLAMWIAMVLLLVWLSVSRRMTRGALFMHLMVFGVVTAPIGFAGKLFERPIKSLRVEADDPSIAAKYQGFLAQWGKPQLKLRD